MAIDALGGQKGAVVALDPKSGAVKVMASVPQYDPNGIPDIFSRLNQDPDAPLLNRTTQGQYPPGSTFKVVTAAAALDSGKFTPDSVLNGDSPKTISGAPLSNAGGESFGDINLTQALTNSVNTVWAQVGQSVGQRTMAKYMERFGFYARPPLDYPAGQRYVSGVFTSKGLTPATSNQVDIGRVAIGQGGLLATPLQMAMVAAAVANGGTLVKPHLTDRIVDPDGRVADDIGTSKYHRVMSGDTATQAHGDDVQRGQGRDGHRGRAVRHRGGRQDRHRGGRRTAPPTRCGSSASPRVEDPKVAVAVTVERSDGFGGTVAAPIAKQVMETLLNQ